MGYCILTEDKQPLNVSLNFPFLGHLQQTFSIQDGRFEEDEHYSVVGEIGSGSSGVVYKAYQKRSTRHTRNDSSFFCIKKVSRPNGIIYSKGRNARLLSRGKEVAVLG